MDRETELMKDQLPPTPAKAAPSSPPKPSLKQNSGIVAKKPPVAAAPNAAKTAKGAPSKGPLPQKSQIKPPSHPVPKPPEKVVAKKAPKMNGGILYENKKLDEAVVSEEAELHRRSYLIRIVRWQNYAIIGLVTVLLLGVPFYTPTYRYFSISAEAKIDILVPLDAPNMTNQALMSWETNSVTEIMTLGFGNFEHQIVSQRQRFTAKGWLSFTEAIRNNEMLKAFKERQLVLTTVPSDVPVITEQGQGLDGVYYWKIQMPIIMTYMTNNNMTKQEKNIISLTITRVPTRENSGGIAIKTWDLGG
jgi:intracellular multiplication protein IcmL